MMSAVRKLDSILRRWALLRCSEAPCSLAGPFPGHPLPCSPPHTHTDFITVVSLIPWHLVETSDTVLCYHSLSTGWTLWTVGRDCCGVMSY